MLFLWCPALFDTLINIPTEYAVEIRSLSDGTGSAAPKQQQLTGYGQLLLDNMPE
jgi:hypothetical protein